MLYFTIYLIITATIVLREYANSRYNGNKFNIWHSIITHILWPIFFIAALLDIYAKFVNKIFKV